jgi:hypothetical protein
LKSSSPKLLSIVGDTSWIGVLLSTSSPAFVFWILSLLQAARVKMTSIANAGKRKDDVVNKMKISKFTILAIGDSSRRERFCHALSC